MRFGAGMAVAHGKGVLGRRAADPPPPAFAVDQVYTGCVCVVADLKLVPGSLVQTLMMWYCME